MNIQGLVEQLLGNGSAPTAGGKREGLNSFLSDKGGAALAGGALGLLLGSKSGRKLGGKILTYGGLAALGTIAYKAVRNHQSRTPSAPQHPMQPLSELPPREFDSHCKAILVALIAASKADGHIDDRERQLIDQEIKKITHDPHLQQWFDHELKKPLDPAAVAIHAKDLSMATEMYLASLLAIDSQSFMEKAYLDELAKQLKLPPELQTELAQQGQRALADLPNEH